MVAREPECGERHAEALLVGKRRAGHLADELRWRTSRRRDKRVIAAARARPPATHLTARLSLSRQTYLFVSHAVSTMTGESLLQFTVRKSSAAKVDTLLSSTARFGLVEVG